MRKLLFATGLLALAFSSCKKEEVIVNTAPAKPPFRVTGLSDIAVQLNPFYQQLLIAQQQVGVVYEYGDQKRVSLRLENLPAGLKDSFYVRSGYPDFSTYISFYNEGVKSGNYTLSLVLQADGEPDAMRYPFNVSVQGDTSCAGYFGGKNFEGSSNCSGQNPNPPVPYNVSSLPPNSSGDTLVFNNYKNDGNSLKLLIRCQSRSVTVPIQVVGNSLVQGYGQLINNNGNFPDVIYLSLNETNSQGNTTYCTYYFQLK